jgi:hypothetical protein
MATRRKQVVLNADGRLELVGAFEAHLILGVERSRIARFLHENAKGKQRIAEPIAEPQCGPIWLRADIEASARELWEAAGSPGTFDEWVVERAVKRAAALSRPLPRAELEEILGRRLTSAQASELGSEPVAA